MGWAKKDDLGSQSAGRSEGMMLCDITMMATADFSDLSTHTHADPTATVSRATESTYSYAPILRCLPIHSQNLSLHR